VPFAILPHPPEVEHEGLLARQGLLGRTSTKVSSGALAEQPKDGNEVRPHVSWLVRCAKHGLRGVVLPTVRVGASLCTTKEWLADFLIATSGQSDGNAPAASPKPPRSVAARKRAVAEATAALDARGV
jgi:hypothetical protein